MNRTLLLFFLLGSLVMIYVMGRTGAPLKTDATPSGILNLELAFNATKIDAVLQAWTADKEKDILAAARLNTWLDFIFIFFYAGFLFLASRAIARSFGGKFGAAGNLIARLALVAGVLDILENTGMFISMNAGHGTDATGYFTSGCSLVKWTLALVAVLYVLAGLVASIRARLTK